MAPFAAVESKHSRRDEQPLTAVLDLCRLVTELRDQGLQLGGHLFQRLRGLRRVGRTHGCGACSFGHSADVFADIGASLGGFRKGASDLVGGCALLFDGTGNRGLDVADLADHLADLADGRDGSIGIALDGFDLAADVFGGLGGLLGEFLHLVGDHGKALSGFAGACGFDGGVERQQIGLLRDGGDHLDDLADLGAALSEFGDGLVGCLGGANRRGGNPGSFGGVLGDLLDAGAHLVGTGGNGLNVVADLFGCGRNHACLGCSLIGVGAHRLADLVQLFRRTCQAMQRCVRSAREPSAPIWKAC